MLLGVLNLLVIFGLSVALVAIVVASGPTGWLITAARLCWAVTRCVRWLTRTTVPPSRDAILLPR